MVQPANLRNRDHLAARGACGRDFQRASSTTSAGLRSVPVILRPQCTGYFLGGQRDDEAVGGLSPVHFGMVTEQAHAGNLAGRRGKGLDDELAVRRPAERDGVERRAFGGEADIVGGVLEVFLEMAAFDFDGAFAIDQPGPRAEDGFAVDGVPRGQLLRACARLPGRASRRGAARR